MADGTFLFQFGCKAHHNFFLNTFFFHPSFRSVCSSISYPPTSHVAGGGGGGTIVRMGRTDHRPHDLLEKSRGVGV